MFLYLPSVSSPPAASLKDIIEQEQCQICSKVESVTEVRAFVLLFSVCFTKSARLKNMTLHKCPWPYCNWITCQVVLKLPWHCSVRLEGLLSKLIIYCLHNCIYLLNLYLVNVVVSIVIAIVSVVVVVVIGAAVTAVVVFATSVVLLLVLLSY